ETISGKPVSLAPPDYAVEPTLPAQQTAPPPIAEPIRLDYDALKIRSWEAEFADGLFEFVPSPRAAKRFSNIYRLLKAPLKAEELRQFEGTDTQPGDFRAAMVLLAVLTGFPDSASAVFASIVENRHTGLAPRDLFAEPAKCGVLPGDRERFQKSFARLLSSGLPDQLKPFAEWLPQVARFSFAAAKVAR